MVFVLNILFLTQQLLGICHRNDCLCPPGIMCMDVYSSLTHKSPPLERIQMSFADRMDKSTAYVHTGIIHSNEKGPAPMICSNMSSEENPHKRVQSVWLHLPKFQNRQK